MSSAYFNDDTISAIITAPNAAAALGVVRISGNRCWEICSTILRKPHSDQKFHSSDIESHRMYRCVLRDSNGEALDDGMFVWMKGPHSFTGEDVVELHLHGNPYLLRNVMKSILHRGAREALPGEFSFRAFKNGKMSLDQAEAVSDLIASRSEESLKRALEGVLGRSKHAIQKLKEDLVNRLAEIEVDIDFSDQGLSILDYEAWSRKLGAWVDRVEVLREEFERSRPLREGIRLALVGAPNSGKSSLFNYLLGEDRSIVSHEAGTTRDVVKEAIYLKGLLFRLSDTAGIRSTENRIESEGIDRSFGEIQGASLVLWLFDGLEELGLSHVEQLESRYQQISRYLSENTKVFAVWNKVDEAGFPPPYWVDFVETHGFSWAGVSAKTGEGVPNLVHKITNLFENFEVQAPDFLISRTRHYEVLGKAANAVKNAIQKVEMGERFPDLLSSDLRDALSKIGEISGEFSTDDLLNHIFAEFCIGK